MRPIWVLLRHRLTRWWRDPTWGPGTVAGQAAALGLVLIVLAPLGTGSYVLGDVLRALFPNAKPLRLINGGMLSLVPVLVGARFMFEAPPSERVTPYVALPLSPRGLLHGQALLSLPSVYTVVAVVLVGPLWATEVWGVLPLGGALAWLAAALLLTIFIAGHGADLLHVLLGRQPRRVLGGLAVLGGIAGADAVVGPDLGRGLSRFLFGHPVGGSLCAATGAISLHLGLVRALRGRLTVNRARRRLGTPMAEWGAAVYRWVERTLPAGRLVALTLRQVARTRRLRGMVVYGSLGAVAIHGWGAALVSGLSNGPIGVYLILACTSGIGGAALGIAPIVFGVSSGHAAALFAQPHRLAAVIWTKIILLWTATMPGSLLLVGICAGLPPSRAAFLLASLLWWWGAVVPLCVWIGVYSRKPVDLSASHFSLRTNSLYEIPVIFLALSPMWIYVGVDVTGAWWTISAGMAAAGLVGLLALVWIARPFVRRLRAHRHEMLAGFRENEPV